MQNVYSEEEAKNPSIILSIKTPAIINVALHSSYRLLRNTCHFAAVVVSFINRSLFIAKSLAANY